MLEGHFDETAYTVYPWNNLAFQTGIVEMVFNKLVYKFTSTN